MYKNKKMATFVASVCALSIVSCSVGIVSFADEENVISNENFETMDSFKDYITSTQGNISIDGDLDFILSSSLVDDAGFFTEDITLDIPISIDDNPAFTEANMNLSIINQEGVELDYTIGGSESKNGLFLKKSGNDIHLFCKEEFALNDTLFVVNVTIPKNMISSGSKFKINLSNVELINGDNKYIPSFPETTFISFSIVGSPIEDPSTGTTTSIGKPIEDTSSTTTTTTTTYGSISTEDYTTVTETTTTPIPTDTTITTTTRITTTTKLTSTEPSDTTTTVSSKKEDNKSDTTTTKISKKDTDTSKSNTSSNTKASSNSSKTSSSKESTSVEKEEKSMNTGSKGILGIIVAGLVSMSTAVAIRKKS